MLRGTTAIVIFLLLPLVCLAASNEYAEVTAYVNGQKVPPIAKASLRVGEGFDVEVVIDLKKDATFSLGLSSPGVTQPYVTESGPGPFAETVRFEGPREGGKIQPRKAGEKFDLKWRLKPTDAWTGGSAPITLDVSFTPPGKSIGDTITFTIANIYIEPLGGAGVPPPAGTPRQPGFELISAFVAVLTIAVLTKQRARE